MKGSSCLSERIRKACRILGPGFFTGASDDDPSGIATYSQAGVDFGMLFSNVIMFFIMLTTGALLYKAGIRQIDTVGQQHKHWNH